MKIIVPAIEIPAGEQVTKVTGSKPYIIKDDLRIYDEKSGAPRTLVALEGTRLLVGADGNANAISARTELVWAASVQSVRNYVNDDEE